MTEESSQWFDPGQLQFKRPYGAAESGQRVRFTVKPLRALGFSRAVLTARWEFDGNRITETVLGWSGLEGLLDCFSGELDTAGYTGLVWYSIRLEGFGGRFAVTPTYQLTVSEAGEEVPGWFGEGVTYQIFPDRFRRLRVPDPTGMVGGRWVHQDWAEEPVWQPDEHGEIRNRDFFGGSLAGIAEKLPYLKGLGVGTVYLCPIFEAAENHRYGAADYEKIDPMLGSREDFEAMCRRAHELGMRVMLDGVFNHTGYVSKYFNGDGFYPNLGAHQSVESPYFGWFDFQQWPDRYTSWWGIYSMPTTNKMSHEWLEYITGENGIIRSWLRAGADGWRLDVVDELPDFVVEAIHKAARAEKPDAVIIGEVWEDASQKIAYDVRRRHVLGGHCDGVMNYPLKNALLGFLLGGDAHHFKNDMEILRQNYPRWAFYSNMNSLDTHDTVRAVTLLGHGGDGKDHDRAWRSAYRLSEEERRRGEALLKLGALVLYAFPGSPTLYYGDEVALEGFEDPFNRRTFPWGEETGDLTDFFTRLGAARNGSAALRKGDLDWLKCQGRFLSFRRTWEEETVVAAVNAGDKRQGLRLPWGGVLELEAMSGTLLSKKNGKIITIL